MKAFTLAAALFAASVPALAHHESAYGLIWKAGYSAPKQGPSMPADLWRYAFVSTFSWKGCQLAPNH